MLGVALIQHTILLGFWAKGQVLIPQHKMNPGLGITDWQLLSFFHDFRSLRQNRFLGQPITASGHVPQDP